jgi:hypothetical protein
MRRATWLLLLAFTACGSDGAAPHPPREVSAAPAPQIQTPPPAPPAPKPTGPIGPAHACAADGDCMNSCNHGAVSRDWYTEQYPGGERCEDGCTSKGTEPAKCIDGLCTAFRLGQRSDQCTRREAQVISGPGPAHSCNTDEDCGCSCTYGAVNSSWYSYSVDPAKECKDGCASKGMSARCEQGRCAAFRMGQPHAGCTGLNVTELMR